MIYVSLLILGLLCWWIVIEDELHREEVASVLHHEVSAWDMTAAYLEAFYEPCSSARAQARAAILRDEIRWRRGVRHRR
jgi:hypothetical protein